MTVPRGEVLIRKGDPSNAFYLVLAGQALGGGRRTEIGPGSIVGEMGVLSRTHRRTATVDAKTDCELGRVSAEDFQRVCFANPSLGLSLVRSIIDRLTREVGAQRLEAAAA
jgi:CRP-like cAMP-binding protein